MFKLRPFLYQHTRDSYLSYQPKLNPKFSVIDCSTGSSQWGMSDLAKQAHQDFQPETVIPYPNLQEKNSLASALLQRFQCAHVTPEMLFLGHGSFPLLERVIHKFLQPGKMLGVSPQFSEIPMEYQMAGGTYNPVPIDQTTYSFPMEALIDKLATGQYAVCYLDNPNNPLGRFLERCDIETLAAMAAKHGTILIFDEAYGDFLPDETSAIRLVSKYDNLIVTRSFSKCLGLAAERVGYMFMSLPLASVYKEIEVPFAPSLYASTLAAATLCDADFIWRGSDAKPTSQNKPCFQL